MRCTALVPFPQVGDRASEIDKPSLINYVFNPRIYEAVGLSDNIKEMCSYHKNFSLALRLYLGHLL